MRILIVLLAAGAVALGFQGQSQPNGTIAGQVVNQTTGAPLQNAIVKLRYFNPPGAEFMVRQTNDAGRFSFTGLWGRDWELSAECRGFTPSFYNATRYSPQARFLLATNQHIEDIVLKLVAQSVVTGKVVDAEGEPVEGAHVTLLKVGYSNGVQRWREVASAETLDNGEYRIPRVIPGHYIVKSTVPKIERLPSESGVETGYAATYHPNVTDASLAAQVDVADGAEIHGIDIHLAPTRLFHLRGGFQSPTGVQGSVTLVDRADRTVVASTSIGPPDYLFDMARIAPGSYLIFGRSNIRPIRVTAQAVDVVGQDIEGLVLSLAKDDYITGVLKAKSADRQLDFRKISVMLDLVDIGMSVYAYAPSPLKIADDLTFRQWIPGEETGVAGFRVRVTKLPEGCYVDSIRYGGRDVPESGIDFSWGDTLEITIGTDGGRIDGAALGADDQPHGRAVVALFPADGKSPPKSLQADEKGAFHFIAIPPGDYKLLAWDDVSQDDLENPEFVKRFDGQSVAITLAASGTATASVKLASQ